MTRERGFAWSWTAVEQALTCMRQWYAVRSTKQYVSEPGPALLAGRKVHDEMAKAVLGTGGIPEERRWVSGLIEKLHRLEPKPLVEHSVCLDESFLPVGKWEPTVWLRAVYDVLWNGGERALVIDWKTGKRRAPSDQNTLLAALLYRLPNPPKKVTTCYVWLEAKAVDTAHPTRSETESLLERLSLFPIARMKELHGSGASVLDVEPSPGPLCRFCPVVSCEHHPTRSGK
jgi:hypothetical protein